MRAWPLWQPIKHNNMAANYNSIAPVYDILSRIIFGSAIVKAQQSFLPFIPANSRLLIVGGGTGRILQEISRQHNSGLVIDYVEVSAAMLKLSKKRNCANNRVNFIELPIENFKASADYDVVITPFVLDNFNREKLPVVFKQLNSWLKPNGLWLYADFVYTANKSPWWHKMLLAVMYFFFRITTGIEANELVDTNAYFEKDFSMIFERSFYSHFIKAVVYRKK